MSNYWIFATDTHVIPSGGTSVLGNMVDWEAHALARHINTLGADGMIVNGDLKDNYGASADSHVALYKTHFWDIVDTPKKKQLPGNHDERNDYSVAGTITTPYSDVFGTPTGYTVTWTAPNIKFIGLYTTILHTPDPLLGYFEISSEMRTFLSDQLASLTSGQKAIICEHPSMLSAMGNEVHASHGGTELLSIVNANASKIACVMCGHTHAIPYTVVANGVTHLNCGSAAYTISPSDNRGGFFIVEYDGSKLIFHYMRATAPYGIYNLSNYTPLEITL